MGYLAARFLDDPHLWLTALCDEVTRSGHRVHRDDSSTVGMTGNTIRLGYDEEWSTV